MGGIGAIDRGVALVDSFAGFADHRQGRKGVPYARVVPYVHFSDIRRADAALRGGGADNDGVRRRALKRPSDQKHRPDERQSARLSDDGLPKSAFLTRGSLPFTLRHVGKTNCIMMANHSQPISASIRWGDRPTSPFHLVANLIGRRYSDTAIQSNAPRSALKRAFDLRKNRDVLPRHRPSPLGRGVSVARDGFLSWRRHET